jgi:hypothetical protein
MHVDESGDDLKNRPTTKGRVEAIARQEKTPDGKRYQEDPLIFSQGVKSTQSSAQDIGQEESREDDQKIDKQIKAVEEFCLLLEHGGSAACKR